MERESHPLRRWTGPLTLLALLSLAGAGIALQRPPDPLPATAPATVFAAGRAMAHVDAMARHAHPVGTAAHDRARAYVVATLGDLGLQVDTQTTTLVVRHGGVVERPLVRNVAARMPGTDPTGAVLIMAHYDSAPVARGAADDAMGVAAILESIRALGARRPLRNDVIVLVTDAEEIGLFGARTFADRHPWMDDVSVVVNLEARGSAGPALMFETGPRSGWVIRQLDAALDRPLASSLFQEIYRRLPNDTDLTVFNRRGVAGLNFANGEGAETYHQLIDAPRRLSRATLQHHGENALAVLSWLGTVELDDPYAPDPVYFYAPGLGLLVYGTGWVVPLALLLVALFAVVTWHAARRGRVTLGGAAAGAVGTVVGVTLSAVAALGIWLLARGAHPEAGSLVGRALYEEGAYGLAVMAVVLMVVPGLLLLLRRWFDAASLALGALALPVAVAVGGAFLAPMASHVFLWPSVFGLAMLAYLARRDPGDGAEPGVAGVQLLLAPGSLLLLGPLVFLFYVFLGIAAAPVLAVAAGLTLATVLPLLDALTRPNRWWLPTTGGAAALVLLGLGLAGAGFDEERPAPTHLVYLLDRSATPVPRASWVSAQRRPDRWLDTLMAGGQDSIRLASYSSFQPGGPSRRAPAPSVPLPGPEWRLVSESALGDSRLLTVELAWPDETILGEVRIPEEVRVVAVDGEAMESDGDIRHVRAWNGARPLRLDLLAPRRDTVRLALTANQPGLPSLPGADTGWVPGRMPATMVGWRFAVSNVTLVHDTAAF